MSDLDLFQLSYGGWCNLIFGSDPTQRLPHIKRHLAQEVQEWIDDPCGEEAADIVGILLHWCHINGVSLMDELRKKAEINYERTWVSDGKGGKRHATKAELAKYQKPHK